MRGNNREKYEDAETFTVTVAMEVQATDARDAASTAKQAVDLRGATDRGQDSGDVYVQRIERPLRRVERIDVIKADDPIDT
jgi:hypothetical protein